MVRRMGRVRLAEMGADVEGVGNGRLVILL
jgi:hypothetical protein